MKAVFSRALTLCLVALFITYSVCSASPAAMYFDPAITHDIFGVNRTPSGQKPWTLNLRLSPFYQHAASSRNKDGRKVSLGDRLGTWYEAGTLFGASSTDFPFPGETTMDDYPTLKDLYDQLYAPSTGVFETFAVRFEGENDQSGAYSVGAKYEKAGVRGEFEITMGGGFGLLIKGGAADFNQTPTSFSNVTPKQDSPDAYNIFINSKLMLDDVRKNLLENDFCLNLARYQTTAFEDTLAKLYWTNPFKFNDEAGALAVTLSPYISVGVWIPTGKKKDQDKAFSIPSGNDGYLGIAFEGALNFDFADTVLINFGAGATFFETKTLSGQRVPNYPSNPNPPQPDTTTPKAVYPHQRAIYPWKATIERTIGPAWNVNLSLIAKNFLKNLSAYFDYVYYKHEHDKITMKEKTAARNAMFSPEILEHDSVYKAQTFQLGLNYEVTPNINLGISGQAHYYGIRVYRTNTILGTISFIF